MCLILFAINEHPDYPLIIAGNRDEELTRPTAPAGYWGDDFGILAGRDLLQEGTWMGVSAAGRVVCVTNVREPGRNDSNAKSRGRLVAQLLGSTGNVEEELSQIDGSEYNGFNLLVFADGRAFYTTNRGDGVVDVLDSGIHGLSNARLNTPWPKVTQGTRQIGAIVQSLEPGALETEPLLEMLSSREVAPDEKLPETGVGLDLERILSPAFIKTEAYGTRSSTVILVGHEEGVLVERTFPAGAGTAEDRRFKFGVGSAVRAPL